MDTPIISIYKEVIVCPECKSNNVATVEIHVIGGIYVHTCYRCKYIITESEWQSLPLLNTFFVFRDKPADDPPLGETGPEFIGEYRADKSETVRTMLAWEQLEYDTMYITQQEPFL